MALDPVCGMTVDPARAAGHVDYDGTTYYFCSKGCAARFGADPKKYLGAAPAPMPVGVSAEPALLTIGGQSGDWICPMDPEVLSDRPGACPMCGMALEPRVADPTGAPNPELVDMTRRLWIAATLGAPLFLLTMGDMLSGDALSRRIGLAWFNWVGFVLATPVVLWCGRPFFHRM